MKSTFSSRITGVLRTLILLFVVCILLWAAYRPCWMRHLRTDIDSQHISNARYFLEHGNFSSPEYNEYQPGAVIFFLILSPLLLIENSNDFYLQSLFFLNILLIFILAFAYRRMKGVRYHWDYILILLAAGPIVFYRFDLFVILLVILTIDLRNRGKGGWGLFLLGAGTLTKIYPAVLLPYFVLTSWKKSGLRTAMKEGAGFLCGLGLLLPYMLFLKVPFAELLESLKIQSMKTVHIESLWGTFLTLMPRIMSGSFAQDGVDIFGIVGVSRQCMIGPLWFYNYFWMLPLAVFYVWFSLKVTDRTRYTIYQPMFILLLFLVFSKILAPQYILWFALLFPLVVTPAEFVSKKRRRTDFIIVLVVLALSQYIYPLRYSELIDGFYFRGEYPHLFYILLFRNVLLVVLLFRFLKVLKMSVRTNKWNRC